MARALFQDSRKWLASKPKKACATLANAVIRDTPVDTRLLQSSWTPDINKFNYSNSGGSVDAVLNGMELGDTFTLMNTQPYVRVIEYTGHSKQAPDGMMWINVANWQAIVRTA